MINIVFTKSIWKMLPPPPKKKKNHRFATVYLYVINFEVWVSRVQHPQVKIDGFFFINKENTYLIYK